LNKKLKTLLANIDGPKAVMDEHAIISITGPGDKSPLLGQRVNDRAKPSQHQIRVLPSTQGRRLPKARFGRKPADREATQTTPLSFWRTSWAAYLLAAGLTLLMLLVRVSIGGRFEGPTMILFTIPIILSAFLGGLGPGLLATLLSALGADYFILPPLYSFNVFSTTQRVQELTLLLTGGLISVICEQLHRSRHRAEKFIAKLQFKESELEAALARQKQSDVASARLAVIVKTSDDAIIGKDLNGVITSWNKSAETIFGYCASEMVGNSITRLIPADRQNEENQILRKIRSGESVEHFETLRRTKNGRLIDVSVTTSPIKDATGNVIGVSKMARDITQRKLAEVEIHRSEGRYRTLFDSLIEGFCTIEVIFDTAGKPVDYRFLETNPAFEKQTGLHNAQGRLMRDLAPDHEAHWFEIYGKIALTGEPAQFENEAKALGRHYYVSAHRVGGPESRMVSILFNDITERKGAEDGLRASEARYRTLFEYAPDGIVIVDSKGYYLDVNASICRMLGYTRDEFIGLHASDIVAPAEIPHIGQALDVIKTKSDYQREWRFRRKDGSIFAVDTIATAMPDGNLLAIIRDITERRKGEDELRASEARYRRLFETANDGILLLDAETGMVVDVNPFLITLLGYSREQFLGKAIWELGYFKGAVANEANFAELKAKEYIRYENMPLETGAGLRIEVEFISNVYLVNGSKVIQCNIRDVSARVKAEAALQESEVRFRTMANSIPQLAWIARADGYIYWYNERWYEYTGTTPEQTEGWDWQSVHDSKMLPKVMERWTAAINSGEPFEMEFPLRGTDGKFRTFLTRIQPLKDPEGRVVQWFGTNTDVEMLKRAEVAIRESEERFRFLNDLADATRPLADPTQIMAVTARMLGEHLHASRCAYADMEQDGEQFTILHDYTDGCASTVGKCQLSLFGARAAATLHGGQTLIIRNVDGELLPGEGADMFSAIGIKAIITCPLVKNGELRALMAVHQTTQRDWKPGEIAMVEDVSERCWATIESRTAEEKIHQLNSELEQRVIERTAQFEDANDELHQSRAELNSLFESLPGLYLVLTPDLKITSVSDAYLKATMTTRKGILGRGLFDVFPDNPDELGATGVSNLRASLERVKRNAATDTMAIQKHDIRRSDGVFEEHYWSPINSPVFGAGREIKYIVHRVEDVTDFVRQKSKPAFINTTMLSARLQQMEAEIFQSSQKLQTANRQLEAANKELEAFSYSISHDLRAPLRAVNGFAEIVLDEFGSQLNKDGRRHLERIRNGAQRMGVLIDDLLSFSRLSRQPMSRQVVDSVTLVQGVINDLSSQREGRQIELKLGELPACRGDLALLKQVWVNLISNAIKYTLGRDPAVIQIDCDHRDNEQVYFVRDNGAGFDMKYAHKLFGVFQRLHRADEFEGTGVGLAIVQRIIHRHGGRIWAEAGPGKGATFYFTLEGKNKI
jgi:PAS domain S-box-containing protein